VVAKVRERVAVSKQAAQNIDVKIFNFRKLNELDVIKQYQFAISKRFAALENFSDKAWENIKESIKTLTKECRGLQALKQHKPGLKKNV
jgi:hypothetical protein